MPGKQIGQSHMYILQMLQRAEIGKVMAAELKASHILAHCRWRRQGVPPRKGVTAATVTQDLTYLRGPLAYAKIGFDLPNVSTQALTDAKPLLEKFQLIGKSKPRDRRPTGDELERLFEYFREKDKRSKIPMCVIIEFSLYSARRISETCRLRWGDVNGADMTCIVRDMKDPKHKKGNDHEFPLLGRAWDIVMAQPRRRPDDPNERIFPYNHKSAGQAYTRAKKALGIVDLRLHDNRAEAASRALEGTLNGEKYSVAETMVLTGHKNPGVLMRVYARLRAKDLHRKPKSEAVPTTQLEQPNA